MSGTPDSAVELPNTKNLKACVDGSALYLYADLSKDFGISSSGKTIVIASSCGIKPLGSSKVAVGLNLFTKGLDKRDLSAAVVKELQGDFVPLGDGFGWRIEPDGVTLCIRIDFAAVSEKPASSGKSILLASSNKPVGKTGVTCGLNCMRPMESPVVLEKLSDFASGGKGGEVFHGERKEFGDGVTVTLNTDGTLCTVEVPLASLMGKGADDDATDFYNFTLEGGVKVNIHLKPPKTKKRKVEKGGEVDDSATAGIFRGKSGNMVRNLKGELHFPPCLKDGQENEEEPVLALSFDPSQTFGVSSSGKSVIVSGSNGFQPIFTKNGRDHICAVNFNAYRPLTVDSITTVVKNIVSATADLSTVTLKTIREQVLENLGLTADNGDQYYDLIKKQATLEVELRRKAAQGKQT